MPGKFQDVFCPWRAYENKSVLADSPCRSCSVPEWCRENEVRRLVEGSKDLIATKCTNCLQRIKWLNICLSKLKWYEENDPRLNDNKACDCYHVLNNKSVCFGTKEMDACDCEGDRKRCNFYPKYRNIHNEKGD